MTKVLILSNSKSQKNEISQLLNGYNRFDITITGCLDGLSLIENNQTFDICISFSDNESIKYREKIYNTLTKYNPTQKIIEIQNEDSKCLFDYECKECLNRNILTLRKPLNIDTLIGFIDNFEIKVCQVLSKNNITANLNHIYFFKHLDDSWLAKLKSHSILKKYNSGNIVFYSNEKIEYFYFLISGNVKQFHIQNDGTITIIKKIDLPSFICEYESFSNDYFTSNVEAVSDSSILCIEKLFFIDMIKNDPQLSFLMFSSLSKNVVQLQNNTISNALTQAHFKVALKLYEKPCILKYTRKKELADELNIAQETLSRALKKLKELEILDAKNEIIDFDKLEELIFSFSDL
ncbi:Crp/Fnr family transcriptional regulator [Arcobacter sp. FWKO B]|uniref:Crp/Fnr family transcriptional regulator n=1 Tax=Arcobacter sp. FWKO B TaxID=2593672 RepID=UPI0018A662F9|nr:Crp/Fnr family transcriptional regulator [Arcobacter sp. FWKO B]QOG12858.1 Crp/Fnr family transcriptional regulator [Arcobacter sp. FWKO B]